MQLKYFFLMLLLAIYSLDTYSQQNKPVSNFSTPSPTAPFGSFSYPNPNDNGGSGPTLQITSMNTPPELIANSNVNSITTYVPIVPIQDAGTLTPGCNPADVKQQLTFLDGNYAPFQSVNRYVANINNQPRHLVQIVDNRVQVPQLNFLPFSSTAGGFVSNAFQKQRDYYNALYPGEGYTSFSESFNFSDASQRSEVNYAPGKSQVGQSRGTISKVITNAANEVRIWSIDPNDGLPVSSGYYLPRQLMGTETILPSGNTGANNYTSAQTRSFTDKDGKLILKMVADGNAGSAGTVTYQSTYYVYDIKGNLIYTMPPKAVEFYENNSNTFQGAENVVNNLCFQNVYDNKGRAIGIHKPGEQGMTWIVYDRKDRPVMRQAPNKLGKEWEVTFYDPYGRAKATSIFANTKNQQIHQSNLDAYTGSAADNLYYYLATINGETQVPGETSIPGNTMMSYAYYDNYDIADPSGDAWASYASNGLQSNEYYNVQGAEIPSQSLRLQGMATGSKVRIVQSGNLDAEQVGEWRTSVNFYDDKGRAIYAVSKDLYYPNGPTNSPEPVHEHYTSFQYDFAGRMINSKHVMTNAKSKDAILTHTEFNKSQFEPATGNLLKTWHKVDDGVWAALCSYAYDELGRLKRKSLADGGEVQDYTYNIRGQLAGINGEYAETGFKNGLSKTFGEALKYDYGFDQKRYDGKISGVIWRGAGANTKYAYGYDYTQNQSLKKADFNYYDDGMSQTLGNDWHNNDMDYSVAGLAYDKGGNILSMNQRGMDPNNPGVPQDIDLLAYNYDGGNGPTNQLTLVEDQGVEVDGGNDFRNYPPGSTGSGYAYDNNGNLVADYNKGIATTYTRFNKPLIVNFVAGSNKFIEYAYDAAGSKLMELVKDDGNGIEKQTEYVGNFIYENGNLKYILTSEGRTVFDDQSATPIREEYFVKDHLGNVRSVINAYTSNVSEYLATYEIASANLENLVFDNLDEIREYKPGADQGDFMAANLDAADPKKRIGSSLLVHVMAGDKVSMNVNNFYENYNNDDESTLDGGDVLGSLLSTLTGGAGGFGGGENHNTQLVNQLFNGENFAAVNDIVSSQNTDASKPKSYLNYVLFNERMEVVQEMTGAFQANGDGDWAQIGTQTAMEVPQNGYLAVYLSNTSVRASTGEGYRVFYDRMVFTVTKGNLLEETHYYPFGLPIKTLSSTATPAEFKENRHKYQGNEFITDLGLNWMDFNNRTYDPQLGRFLQVDPLAAFGGQDRFSPYAAMGNMPEMMVDPLGLSFDMAETGAGDRSGGSYAGNLARLMSMGGGGGGGSFGDWSGMNASLSAFGYGGLANVHEWAEQQRRNSDFNKMFEDAGIDYRVGKSGQFERFGGVGGIRAYADKYLANSSQGGSRRRSDGDRRWRSRNYDRGTNGSPFDERGRELLGRWLDGSGKPLYTVGGEWGKYMMANELLTDYIKGILSTDAQTRTTNGKFNFEGSAEIENGYETGYKMLHGTNGAVGGFKMSGDVIMGPNNIINYILRVQWNDIIDPNPKYGEDVSLSNILHKLYTPKDYEVHINWIVVYRFYKP